MKTLLIAYDLHKLGQRYSALRTKLKDTFPSYWACLESTFIVKTDMTASQVRDLCMSTLDTNDELLVIDCGPLWATWGFSQECNDWLRDNV